MTTLDELLVEIGIDAEDLASGVDGVADDVERSLDGVGDAAEAMGRDIAQVADQASDAMDAVGESADQAAADAEQAAQGVEQSLGGIGAAAAGAAVGALFMAGLTSAMDAKHANDKLATQLGLTKEEAQRAGDVAGDLFAQGFGQSIDDVNAAINGVASNMGGFGKLTQDELTDMSAAVLALSDRFDQDLGQTSRAVGQLMKTGMADNATEALDIIAAGLKRGADLGGDFLDTIVGGADNLSSFGFSGEQATGLIIQGLDAGAESAEQVTGLFEELVGNVSAGGDDLAETMKMIGLDGQQMAKDLTSGGPAANEALDKLLDGIRKLEDPIKQDAVVAALFGEEGAAMQKTLLAIDPSEATRTLGEFGGVAEEVTNQAAASQSMDAIWRSISTTLGEFLAPALKTISEFLAEHPVLLKILVPVLLGLAVAIGIAVIAQWAWNTALWAFPGTWIIAGIIALIAVIVLIIVYWDEIAAATGEVWDWITAKLSAAWDLIMLGVATVWDWISGIVNDTITWIADKVTWGIDKVMDTFDWLSDLPGKVAGWFGDVVDWVAGLPGRISRAASGMWDGIKNSFKDTINSLIWLWNNLSFTIGGGSFMGMDIPELTLHTPDIPYLAEGGITTGPTLAMIGEGAEQEAVLPLSKLDGMLRSVAGNVGQVGREPATLVIRSDGSAAGDFIVEQLRVATRNRAGGSVVQLIEEE
jgi:hypothetical protein